jgi:outer membrane protein assembly factor BamB
VRQLLEMLEIVTEMESTYLTKIDIDARLQHILYSRNSQQMQIPEGLSVPWGDTLCKRAIDSSCFFSNDVGEEFADCDAAHALGITSYMSIPIHLNDGSLYGTLCATSTQKKSLSERGEQNDRLLALSTEGGVTLWTQSDLLHRLLTAPALYNGSLVVGDSEGYMHWIDPSNGRFVAQDKVDSSGFLTEPVVADGKLLIQAKDGTLYAITR